MSDAHGEACGKVSTFQYDDDCLENQNNGYA